MLDIKATELYNNRGKNVQGICSIQCIYEQEVRWPNVKFSPATKRSQYGKIEIHEKPWALAGDLSGRISYAVGGYGEREASENGKG